MGYNTALEKAWEDVKDPAEDKMVSVKFLSDTYDIDRRDKIVHSASCNIPAKDHVAILVLHYLAKKNRLKTLPDLTGEWIDFNRLEGGEGYYPAFKRRTIDHIIKKYGADPDALLKVSERIPAEKASGGDVGIVIKAFEGVPVLVTMWRSDDEFGPSANILFDKNISGIFCTEDVVVLTECVVHQL